MSKKLRPGDHAYRGTGDSFSNPTIKQTGKMEDLQPIASDVSSSKAPSKPFISVTANIVDITHREDSLGRPYLLWGPNGEIIELNKAYLSQRRKTSPKETNFSGFLIGRHPECDLRIDGARISNRHCVIHKEIHGSTPTIILTDLSSNGTRINGVIVGRNKRRELLNLNIIVFNEGSWYEFESCSKHLIVPGFQETFKLGSLLSSGPFSKVHRTVDKDTGTEFAVKVFKRQCPEDLLGESAILMSVAHPNIVCLNGTYEDMDGRYLVFELAYEGDLFDYIIKRKKLSEEETRKIFKQLLGGLEYLHDRNIIHRDIKPENIWLLFDELEQPFVKLAGFEMATTIGDGSFSTSLCGTPSYVAPEILESAENRKYTQTVDVWSLGVVLYTCLCGFPPFSDEFYSEGNPYTLSQQIKMGRFDFPSPDWDTVSDSALDLIECMLEVDPHKRITIRHAIEHPWIAEGVLANDGADPSASPANNAENYMRVRQSAKHPSPRTALPPRDLSKVRIGNLRGNNETKAKTTEVSHNLDTTLLGDTLEDVIATTTQILSQFDRSKLQGEPKAEKLEKRTPERSFGALSRFDRSKLEEEPKVEKLEKRTPERSFGALSQFDRSKLEGEPKAEKLEKRTRERSFGALSRFDRSLQPSVRKRAAKPIPKGHEAIQHHETLSPVVQSVFLELGFHLYSFTMMLCERYGEDLDNIVLFVWIPPASTYDEQSYYPRPIATEEDLVSRLKECCKPFGIEVEIRHGVRENMAATEPWGSEKPAGHFFLSQLHLGAGIRGRRYFGTIGGLLIDRKTGKKYALTCGHVLKSSDSVYSMDSETVGKVCGQIEAIKSQWLERIAENLQQLEHHRRGPHDTHNMLEDLLLQLHDLKQASIFFKWQEKQIEQVHRIKSQEELLNVLRIGKVEENAIVCWVYADGMWKGQDWALMEVDGIVPGSNVARWPTWLGFPGRHHTLRETSEPVKDNMSVMKMGRSTGFTDGILSTVPVISADGGHIYADLAVYPVKGVDFAQPGDSGALAFDKHGRVVGMVYSGIRPMVAENIDDLEQNPCPVFLESFDDIKSWIKEELGMDVVLDTDYGAPPWWTPPQHSVDRLEGEGMRHEEEQVARPTDGEASNDDDEFNPVQSIASTSASPPVETSGPIRLISVSETVPVEQRTHCVEAESYMESATIESTISIDHHFCGRKRSKNLEGSIICAECGNVGAGRV